MTSAVNGIEDSVFRIALFSCPYLCEKVRSESFTNLGIIQFFFKRVISEREIICIMHSSKPRMKGEKI